MCLSPSKVYVRRAAKFEPIVVACKKCKWCRQNKRNDYVGRCLAEASTSEWQVTLTLTYREPDINSAEPLRHKVLTPSHFQKFIRSLRRKGHNIRYFACGEYGERKRRAHFHCVLFGNGPKPVGIDKKVWPQKQNFHCDTWKWGFVYADWAASESAINYVAGYIHSEEKSGNEQVWRTCSTKPTLGDEFFRRKAEQVIAAGVLPSNFYYLPPGGDPRKKYLMTGATRIAFLKRCSDAFLSRRKLRKGGQSEVLEAALEQLIKIRSREREEELWGRLEDVGYQEYIDDFKELLDKRRHSEAFHVRKLIEEFKEVYHYDEEEKLKNWITTQPSEYRWEVGPEPEPIQDDDPDQFRTWR